MEDLNLQKIIADFPDCVTNGAKLKGIILDLYPDTPKSIVNTLAFMVNSGIVKVIRDTNGGNEADKSSWKQKIENEGFAEKFVVNCLKSFIDTFRSLETISECCDSAKQKNEEKTTDNQRKVFQANPLSEFEIADGVLIGYKGSAKNVVIPDGVMEIGKKVFENCKFLESITIPNGVMVIGEEAFQNCTLITSITIPKSVKTIGDRAFNGCFKLVEIINNSTLWIKKGDVLDNSLLGYYALNVKTSGRSDVVNQDGYLFYTYNKVNYLLGYSGEKKNLELPENYNGEDYEIYKFAFCNGGAYASVAIPGGVTSIGDSAFKNCGALMMATIGSNVTRIGNYAFYGCESLMCVRIPDSVTIIGWGAFENCAALALLQIGDKVKTIEDKAFYHCSSLLSVTIGSRVISIGPNTFAYCDKLMEVINRSLLQIEKGSDDNGYVGYHAVKIKTSGESDIFVDQKGYLFYANGSENILLDYTGEETELLLPGNCKGKKYKIDNAAFKARKKITKIIIPDGIDSIGNSAFEYCTGLKTLIIENGVTSIGRYAFDGCSSLISATIPNSVDFIGWGAFEGCSALKKLDFRGTRDQWQCIERGRFGSPNWRYGLYGDDSVAEFLNDYDEEYDDDWEDRIEVCCLGDDFFRQAQGRAILYCPECGGEITDPDAACPICGCIGGYVSTTVSEKKTYLYCSVIYADSLPNEKQRQYHYISNDRTVRPGDHALVYVGPERKPQEVIIQKVEEYSENYPYPPERTKRIIKKVV